MPISHEDFVAFTRARDPHTVFAPLGIRVVTFDKAETVVALDIDEKHYQHAGIVHGGVYVLLMESAASIAAALSVDIENTRVAGQEISASHVRPSSSGTLTARAKPLHVGKSQIVYACDVDNDGKLVSTGRCTIAVRPNS